jgi:hypothetical protein
MPKVKGLTLEQKVDYQRGRISDACEYQVVKHSIRKKDIAKIAGLSPQAVSLQFSRKSISTDVLMAIVTLSDMDAKSVKDMLTIQQ